MEVYTREIKHISHECKGFNLVGEKGEKRKAAAEGSNPVCLAVHSRHDHCATSHHSNQPLSILLSYCTGGTANCSLTSAWI